MQMEQFYTDQVNAFALMLGLPAIVVVIAIAAASIWAIVWKGLGLWKAARDGQKWWFLAFLLINDLGILEIIYIFWLSKKLQGKTPSLFDQPVADESSGAIDGK